MEEDVKFDGSLTLLYYYFIYFIIWWSFYYIIFFLTEIYKEMKFLNDIVNQLDLHITLEPETAE